MEDIDLYKLPKDVLIKLLATFRQDVEKTLEDKYAKQIKKLQLKKELFHEIMVNLDDRGIFYNVERCGHKDCSHYMIQNDNDIFFRTSDMYSCQVCIEVWYCSSHYSNYLNANMECNACSHPVRDPQEPDDVLIEDRQEAEIENLDEEHVTCSCDTIAVFALENLPDMYYSVDDGYIMRIGKDRMIEVVAIVRPNKCSVYELHKQENWDELTEQEEKDAHKKGDLV